MDKVMLSSLSLIALAGLQACASGKKAETNSEKPNILVIYTDDLGYGDLSCYGATKIKTPNIDRLAKEGLRFTNAHATSATSTPSRYSLLTGEYAWRKAGTGIAPGDAPAIILPDRTTLPSILQKAGYYTGVVGKWHLGLGPQGGPNWNAEITPGPQNIGFDYSYLIPATQDRVPCVYVENGQVINLDPIDPIKVRFDQPIGNEPTGKDHPEMLRMKPSHGHNNTIVNGISRIGYMSGGQSARWIDENMADTIVTRAIRFIENHKSAPFFLYYSTNGIHVPRTPHPRFAGKSGLGARGDVILELDWCVGEVLKTLDSLNLTDKTMIIFSSDNGPVVDDGYFDESVENLNGHIPGGPFRGGKYSAFDAGTRVPFIIRWPGHVEEGTSDALVSQIDLAASLASLTGQKVTTKDAFPDSHNYLKTFLGKSQTSRDYVVEHAMNGCLSVIRGNWKYIEPHKGPKLSAETQIELGNDTQPQLYDLSKDPGEKTNVASQNPAILKEMTDLLQTIRGTNVKHEESGVLQ